MQKRFIILMLNCCILQFASAGDQKENTNFQNDTLWNLSMVFSSVSDNTQEILKLYKNNTYEFLTFRKLKNKCYERRYTGIYKNIGEKILVLQQNSSGDPSLPKYLFLPDEKTICTTPLSLIGKEADPVLTLDNNEKYGMLTYMDSVFGKIDNDFKARKKIQKPEKETPEKVEAETETKTWDIQEYINSHSYTGADDNYKISAADFKKIKAVLVVGSDDISGNVDFINEISKLGNYLKSLGVDVKEFYTPKAIWSDIVKASEGAQIFLYAGHGTHAGFDSEVGGLVLSDGTFSSEQIMTSLKLHKNALVLFTHVCFGAGSSASDDVAISQSEAIKRVSKYAEPFIKAGIGGYYADNYYFSAESFLREFFKGENMKNIYVKNLIAGKIETIKPYQFAKGFEIGVSSKEKTGVTYRIRRENGVNKTEKIPAFKEYDHAFVGRPGFTVMDFFK